MIYKQTRVLYGLYFRIRCPVCVGAHHLAPLPTLAVGKGNPLPKEAHSLRSAPVTLCGCAVRFSCSIARCWELCFHFKKVEAEGIV